MIQIGARHQGEFELAAAIERRPAALHAPLIGDDGFLSGKPGDADRQRQTKEEGVEFGFHDIGSGVEDQMWVVELL